MNNDYVLNNLNHLKKIGQFGKGIVIGVIDGLVDLDHPEITNANITVINNSQDKTTDHGTAVTSVICSPRFGIAPAATIINIPIFTANGYTNSSGCSQRTLAKAIDTAIDSGCTIINISGSSLSDSGLGTDELRNAIERCHSKNIIVVAAVGNEGQQSEAIPASYPSVLAVGASDDNDIPATFNNYGRQLIKKMLIAPGIDVPVAMDKNITTISGSSFSTPLVSGILALLLNIACNHKIYSNIEAKNLLFSTAKKVKTNTWNGNDETLHFLCIPKLLSHIKKHLNKRQTDMENIDNLETQPNEYLEDITSEFIENNVSESSYVNQEIQEASEKTPPSLKLDHISDPAPNINVHAHYQPNIKSQAFSDPRSVQQLEKVFLIGTIGYDFGTEARTDYFVQVMKGKGRSPYDPVHMAEHLSEEDHRNQANALIWTLKIDGIPVYAIRPDNQFAMMQFMALVEFLKEQELEKVERVSIAGVIDGETRLLNGQVIPTVSPVLRGMFNWNSSDLINSYQGKDSLNQESIDQLENFIKRVYYELRNRGAQSEERAINYAATNAFQLKEVFWDAVKESLFLNKIGAERSPVSRPESDCWDVVLEFFNPKERLTQARKLYRYTIDVSDTVPVTIGDLRSWYAY